MPDPQFVGGRGATEQKEKQELAEILKASGVEEGSKEWTEVMSGKDMSMYNIPTSQDITDRKKEHSINQRNIAIDREFRKTNAGNEDMKLQEEISFFKNKRTSILENSEYVDDEGNIDGNAELS